MRSRLAMALAAALFLVLAGTGVSQAFWRTAVDASSTVAAASLSANCTPATRLQNGSFEIQPIPASSYRLQPAGQVPPWSTTDTAIEIWSSGFNGVPAPVGNQFAEVNANINGTLWQDVATTPGQTIRWSLLQRARVGTDVMRVSLGSATGVAISQGTYTATTAAWVRHEGLYTVPAGQIMTRFSITAVSTGSGNTSIGNFVDDVSMGSGPCLVASSSVTNLTTSGGATRIGDTLEYTTTITNIGGSLALTSAIAATPPTGIQFVPGSFLVAGASRTDAAGDDQGEYNSTSRSLTARLGLGATAAAGGSISPDQVLTFRFRAVVQPGATNFDYIATASYTDYLAPQWPLTAIAPALSTTVTLGADVAISTLATPAPTAGGASASWTFTVTNNGPLAASGVSVALTLPAALSAAAATRATGTVPPEAACTPATGTARTCTIGALAAGVSRTITVSGVVPAATPAGPLSVTGAVTSTASATVYDHTLANNNATNTATVTAETTAPTAPSAVTTNTATAGQIVVGWTASTDNVAVTGYQVFRNGVLAGTVSTTSFTDIGRTSGTAYVYTVRALDAAGNASALSGPRAAVAQFSAAQYYKVGYPKPATALCLEAASALNNAVLRTNPCAISALQNWRFIATSGSYYNVIPSNDATRAWALTTTSSADGIKIRISSSGNISSNRAQWLAVPEVASTGLLTGTYIFVNRESGLCLDVEGQSETPGVQPQQFTCSSSAAQSFTLTTVTP